MESLTEKEREEMKENFRRDLKNFRVNNKTSIAVAVPYEQVALMFPNSTDHNRANEEAFNDFLKGNDTGYHVRGSEAGDETRQCCEDGSEEPFFICVLD